MTAGGGTLTVTDGEGLATVTWTLGEELGANAAQATLPAAAGASVPFSATAIAGEPGSIQAAPNALATIGDTGPVLVERRRAT